MYQLLLLKSRRHLCKGSMEYWGTRETKIFISMLVYNVIKITTRAT